MAVKLKAIDPRILTTPGQSTSGFHRPGFSGLCFAGSGHLCSGNQPFASGRPIGFETFSFGGLLSRHLSAPQIKLFATLLGKWRCPPASWPWCSLKISRKTSRKTSRIPNRGWVFGRWALEQMRSTARKWRRLRMRYTPLLEVLKR